VAPGTAVDGCSSNAEGVAANTPALRLAHNVIVLAPIKMLKKAAMVVREK